MAVAKTTATKTAATPKVAKTSTVDAAGRRKKTPGEAPQAALVEKGTTATIDSFVDYIKAETGYDVDPMSVQLGSSLRGAFQKSEGNQERLAARKLEIAAEIEARAAAREERATRKAEREAARAAKAAEPKPEKAAPAPKAPAKPKAAPAAKAAPAKAPAKKPAATPSAAPSRRRPAAKTAAADPNF